MLKPANPAVRAARAVRRGTGAGCKALSFEYQNCFINQRTVSVLPAYMSRKCRYRSLIYGLFFFKIKKGNGNSL